MSTTLLTTKLYIPPIRPGLVPRPHLIDQLTDGLNRKLTLVSAPAGYGKSTLLSEWIHQTGVPVAWLSLDQGDNIPSRFWSYFVAALHTIPDLQQSGVGQSLLSSLQSRQPPPIDVLLTSLINEINELPERYTLILDDLHLITDSYIHESFFYLLENLPSTQHGLHLVIATRRDPPWPLARLRVRSNLTELRELDLRFTPQEVAHFLNQTMQFNLPSDDIIALDKRTEGWIAGLQMAAISMQRRSQYLGEAGISGFIEAFTGSHRFVMDYLLEEVLDQEPSEIQDFLIQTSILSRLTAPLCDTVTGRNDSQTLLAQSEQANMFLIPLDDVRSWYRYHHLFADLMHRKLERVNPHLTATLHQRASQWFEENGFLDEAVTHALAAPDFDRAAGLIEQHGMQMIVRSEVVTLQRWLDALPQETVTARAWLCIYHAWTRYYAGPREQVEDHLLNAERILLSITTELDHQPSPPLNDSEIRHIRGHISALRAYAALQSGELDIVAKQSRQALEHLPAGDYARATSAIALAETFRASGDLTGWYQAYATAKTIALECDNLPMAVSAHTYMADQLTKQGKLHEAFENYQEALQLANEPQGTLIPAAGLPYVKLGNLLREWNDLAAAREYLTIGIKLCHQWGHSDSLVIGYVSLARVDLAEGDQKSASETFRKAEQLVRQTDVDPWAVSLADDCRIRLWLAKGNLVAVTQWVKESGLKENDELDFLGDLEHINLARVLLAQGYQFPQGDELTVSLSLLKRLLEKASAAKWIGKVISILILQALAFQARHQENDAMSALERALNLARSGGYVSIFIDEGTPLEMMLRRVVERDINSEYARQLLTALANRKESQSSSLEHADSSIRPSQRLVDQPFVGKTQDDQPLVDSLSERELQVLKLMDTRLSQQEIAQELYISVSTVRTHIRNIYAKLDVHQRYEAIHRAKEIGLL